MAETFFKKSIYFIKTLFYNDNIQQGFNNRVIKRKGEKEMEETRKQILERLERARKIKEQKRAERKETEEKEKEMALLKEQEERKQDKSVGTIGSDLLNKQIREVRLNKGTNPNSEHRKKYIEIVNGEHKFTKTSALNRANEVYQYLLNKTKKGYSIPCMQDLSKELNIPYSTLRDTYLILQSQKKLTYSKGRITLLKVAEGTIDENVYKEVKTQTKLTKNDFLEKYDNAVKEIISDLIKNSTATSKEDFIKYIESITNVTDTLRNKLI